MNNVLEIDRNYTTNLIQNLFNWYNGKINVINRPAKLIIDWGINYDSIISGHCRNPNKVLIFPFVIGRYSHRSIDEYNINLACTIIHELHHIDQDISFVKYREDSIYREMIEKQCNLEMYYFILNHTNELKNLFNIPIELLDKINFKDAAIGFETGQLFTRMTFQSHVLSIMKDLLDSDDNDMLRNIASYLYNMDSRIIMRINNQIEFDIKNGNMGMPIAQFNDLMDQYIFIYPIRECMISLHVSNMNACIIDIIVNGKKPMCHYAKPISNPMLKNTIYSNGILI